MQAPRTTWIVILRDRDSECPNFFTSKEFLMHFKRYQRREKSSLEKTLIRSFKGTAGPSDEKFASWPDFGGELLPKYCSDWWRALPGVEHYVYPDISLSQYTLVRKIKGVFVLSFISKVK